VLIVGIREADFTTAPPCQSTKWIEDQPTEEPFCRDASPLPAGLTSELEQIEGIGAKTITKLLREFGSLERVREASQEELAKLIGPSAARRLREYYNAQAAHELRVLS
jgi:predicted flap endonuclease-1-like 5' DNA nuclease